MPDRLDMRAMYENRIAIGANLADYWSSTLSSPSQAWGWSATSYDITNFGSVRCVRTVESAPTLDCSNFAALDAGNPMPGALCSDRSRYVGKLDGIHLVADFADLYMNWTSAMSQCENMTKNGNDDWILPNRSEISFMFSNKENLDMLGLDYWSATDWELNSTYAWGALSSAYKKSNAGLARCIRRISD